MNILKKSGIKIGACVLLAVVFLFYYYLVDSSVVATAGECKIRKEELQYYIDKNRSYVVSYFYNKYQADAGDNNFWEKSYHGEIPKQVLFNLCFEELAKVKALQLEGVKYGLLKSCDYKDFKEELERINIERNQKLGQGGVIYGPQNYDVKEYITYISSTLENSLKEILAAEKWKFTEEEFDKLYLTLEGNDLKRGYSICVANLYLSNEDKSISQKEGNKILKQAGNYLLHGKTKKDMKKQIKSQWGREISCEFLELNSEKIHREDTVMQNLYNEAIELSSKTMGTIRKEGNGVSMLCVLSKKELGKKELDEVKNLVYSKWINQKFESYITKQAEKLDIHKCHFIERKVVY